MDTIEVLQERGNVTDPSRLRVSHENRVLSTNTRFTVSVAPQNNLNQSYPVVEIVESPPVRCFLYDWWQYLNFKLQRDFGNIITGKEEQIKDLHSFTIYPRRQASYCRILSVGWESEYTDEPAQTIELYALLDQLIKLPDAVFEDQEIDRELVTRITPAGDVRVTPNGDTRISFLLAEGANG